MGDRGKKKLVEEKDFLSKDKVSSFLVDENLDYVLRELNSFMRDPSENSDFCHCLNCLLDILALTLNKSSSRYRVLGRHAHKEWAEVQVVCKDIRAFLKESITIVRETPHHE